MKTLTIVLAVIVLTVVTAVGQNGSAKKDILEREFININASAKALLKESNVRLTHTFEYFDGNGEVGDLIERRIEEQLISKRWRVAIDSNYPRRSSRIEYMFDGNSYYQRLNRGKWTISTHNITWGMLSWDSEHRNVQYRYLGESELNGEKAEKYEVESLRIANEFATAELQKVGGIRLATYWFDIKGRILKKLEVNNVDNSKATWVETQLYEYDPKDLKIEAPVK